jgi:hypothetical protein
MNTRKPAGIRRRDFTRYAAGLGAAAAMAPRFGGLARAAASQQSAGFQALWERIKDVRAEQFGVNEAFRAVKFGLESGAGATRYIVQWNNAEKQRGTVDPNYFMDKGQLLLDLTNPMSTYAMVIGTPSFAGGEVTSPPEGLGLPAMEGGAPNPNNTFATFMYNLAKAYAGKLDTFAIWNEVEIPSGATGNGRYFTWGGDAKQYYDLVKAGAIAAKEANPNAKIITSPYSYSVDQQAGIQGDYSQRLPFFDAFEAAVGEDRANAARLIDGVALNLYRNPHDMWDRVWGAIPDYGHAPDKVGFRRRLERMGLAGKQLWITETNAMPYDDPVEGWNPGAKGNPFEMRLTLQEQPSFVWQGLALAVAAGWNKVFWQALQDDKPVVDELWGLVRAHDDRDNADEGRARPAYRAFQLASRLLGDAEFAGLYIRVRPDSTLARVRRDASRYKWGLQAVVAQKSDLRTTVLWNNTPDPITVTVASKGVSAVRLTPDGRGSDLPTGGRYTVELPAATRKHPAWDPPNYYFLGGEPVIIVETGVGDHAVDIAGTGPANGAFILKEARHEDGSQPDGNAQGDIAPNAQNPSGDNPNFIGRFR